MDNSKKEIIKNTLDKVKLVDAGVKSNHGMNEPCCLEKSSDSKIYYPNLYLSSKEAPMLSGSEVGEEITLLIKTKVVSHSVRENSEKKNEDFSLEIKKIGVVSVTK